MEHEHKYVNIRRLHYKDSAAKYVLKCRLCPSILGQGFYDGTEGTHPMEWVERNGRDYLDIKKTSIFDLVKESIGGHSVGDIITMGDCPVSRLLVCPRCRSMLYIRGDKAQWIECRGNVLHAIEVGRVPECVPPVVSVVSAGNRPRGWDRLKPSTWAGYIPYLCVSLYLAVPEALELCGSIVCTAS